jgi:predicted ATPase
MPWSPATISRLRLERFKSFKQADLFPGPFTLLVGTNASGKSNLRDAFRFLHGVGRGYSVAEIFGEKRGEGGELQWQGIRGGTREAAFNGSDTFALEVSWTSSEPKEFMYRIQVEPGTPDKSPRVVSERLLMPGAGTYVFDSDGVEQADPLRLAVRVRENEGGSEGKICHYDNKTPLLAQYASGTERAVLASHAQVYHAGNVLRMMRFFDWNPDAMRAASFPGQVVLGDRGDNLSAVLQAVCEDPLRKQTLIRWIRELVPMDIEDLEFYGDQVGRVSLTLVERGGRRTSAFSASDGTLRFLAALAALLGPKPPRLYFFEELENGIHPTRLHLLLELMERIAAERDIQIVATTHSPQLLSFVRPETLEHAALTYRLEGQPDARIRRIVDIPDAKTVLERADAGHLLATGWLENAVAFAEPVAEVG